LRMQGMNSFDDRHTYTACYSHDLGIVQVLRDKQ